MMDLQLVPIEDNDLQQYKIDMQEAFQKGYEDKFGQTEEEILPEDDIDRSLNANGSIAYKALAEGKMVGGAIVVINSDTQYNHLDFLFVKYGTQSKGIGQAIWNEVEKLHPQTKVWETCTPYFEKRNIYFYVNKCGFHIVEFLYKKQSGSDMAYDYTGDKNEEMFIFQKQMRTDCVDTVCRTGHIGCSGSKERNGQVKKW